MNDYLKSQSKTNEAIIANTFSNDELSRFSKSDYRWVDNRAKPYRHRTVKKGEIYQFEFGKNYKPEMSYEHRGLVIGVKQKLLYVLPIFSYNSAKHLDVYHPVDFPNSKSDLFLLKNSEFSFITHDSVLKLNDIRTVSVNRILYPQKGSIPLTSDVYKKIEQLTLKKYFPEFSYEAEQMLKKIEELTAINNGLNASAKSLSDENKILKEQIETLKKQIAETVCKKQ